MNPPPIDKGAVFGALVIASVYQENPVLRNDCGIPRAIIDISP